MIARISIFALRLLTVALFAAALVWPVSALILRCLEEGPSAATSWWPGDRQVGLLLRSFGLAAGASVLALAIGMLVTGLSGRRSDPLGSRPCRVMLLSALLFPPMVYAFGWQRILPGGFPAELRCIVTWALWAWPIPAAILSAAWRSRARDVLEAAALETTGASSLLRIGAPLLIRETVLAVLLLFALFFADYAVPHACGLAVYATELLSWATSSSRVADTLLPAIPMVAMQLMAVITLLVLARRATGSYDAQDVGDVSGPRAPLDRGLLVITGVFLVAQILPLAGLIAHGGSWRSMIDTWHVHGGDLAWSAWTSAVGAMLAVGGACGLLTWTTLSARRVTGRSTARAMGLAALLVGALPGGLIGIAFIAAYNSNLLGYVYDHWTVLSLGYVARFGWIAYLAAIIALPRRFPRTLVEQSAIDGASPSDRFRFVTLPLILPDLVVLWMIISALGLAEVPTTDLLRVPGYTPVSQVLIESFHRLEDGKMAAICIWLMLAALPAAILIGLRRPRRNIPSARHLR